MNFATSKYRLVIKLPARYFSHVFLPLCNLVLLGLSSFALSVNKVITVDLLKLPLSCLKTSVSCTGLCCLCSLSLKIGLSTSFIMCCSCDLQTVGS